MSVTVLVFRKRSDTMSLTVNNGNGLSTLFSSLNSNNNSQNGVSGLSSLLSEYNSIRNGSYAKLAKQYYSGSDKVSNKLFNGYEDEKSSVTEKFKDDEKISENKSLISDVSTFRKNLSAVKSDDTLFEKKNIKDANGNEKEDYDYDKIYSKLSDFVKSYNSVIENGSESDSQTVLRNTLSMTNTVDTSRKSLESIGITVNLDNTLSIDKDALMKGDMGTAKYLFGGTSNLTRQLDTLATNVASQAASDVYSLGGYTSTGAYKQTLETIYNATV